MPGIPSCLLEPIWAECEQLIGVNRRRIPDPVVLEHMVDALAHGTRYERIATAGC